MTTIHCLRQVHFPKQCRGYLSGTVARVKNPHNIAEVPPESPDFVPVPRSKQPQADWKPWVKGVLPRPRDLLRNQRRTRQIEQQSTVEASSCEVEALTEVQKYQRRQRDLRRRNLEESVRDLQARKAKIAAQVGHQGRKRQAANAAARDAPESAAELLTRPSVLQKDQLRVGRTLSDPLRASRLNQTRENVAVTQTKQVDRRGRLLHELYVNSKDFIVTPEKLDKVVEAAFDENNPELFSTNSHVGKNIWVHGFPETTSEMLGLSRDGRRPQQANNDSQIHASRRDLHKERVTKLGEMLTGGRLSK